MVTDCGLDMSPSDIVIATLFYQFSLYVCVRLARRGFTLGELGVVCNAATALFMETVNLTRMKVSCSVSCPWDTANCSADPLTTYTLHQDIPTSYSSSYLSTRPDPWIPLSRSDPLSTPLPLTTPCSTPSSTTQIPSRKASPSASSRTWILRRIIDSMWWVSRNLDEMVIRLERPIYLGCKILT